MKSVVRFRGYNMIPMSIDEDFANLVNSIDEDLLSIEGLTRDFLDIPKRFIEYSKVDNSKFSIEGNSNTNGSKNYSNRQSEVYKALDKLLSYYYLWQELKDLNGLEKANEAIKESIAGGFMIHDLTNGGVGIDYLYCTTMLCKNVMNYGRPYNELHSIAPKYSDSFIGQIIELVVDASNIYAGAVALPDFFVAYSYYTKKEGLSDSKIKQQLQRMVHLINNPYRPSHQSPFTNLTILTESGIVEAFGGYEYKDGSLAIDNIEEILKVQKIFATYFGQGIEQSDGVKKVATFPVITLNIVRDTIKDDKDYIVDIVKCFKKYLNFNLYVGSADKFASCCRLVNELDRNSINSFGSGAVGEQTVGSSRVLSYNLMDIALETVQEGYDREKFFSLLEYKMIQGLYILKAQRSLVQKRLDEGFNIFYNLGWVKLSDYFSTYGAGGLHEACKILFNGNLDDDYTDEELIFAKRIPQFMEKFARDNSNNDIKLNVEFLTPLESGAKRLGKRIDNKYGLENTFVSNQLLPLTIKTSIARRLEIEDAIGGATSAGGILHLNCEGELSFDNVLMLVSKIVTYYPNIEHFAINKTIAYCEDSHETLKNTDKCSICSKKIVEKITRAIGYFKPVKNFSHARQEEYDKRVWHSKEKQKRFIGEE